MNPEGEICGHWSNAVYLGGFINPEGEICSHWSNAI